MYYNEDHLLQKGLIITDNPSNKPILDFDSYSSAIIKIIKESHPNFTLGIIGEWGTGKTTLMNLIKTELKKGQEDIVSVWFDAWKYENEKEFALVPLLKTINYSINDNNNEKKKNLKEALKEAAIFTLGISNDLVSSIVTNYAGKEFGGFFKKSLEDVTTKLIPQLKDLKKVSEADENSIFYNGINKIQDALNSIRKDNGDFRVIIFIDDLDRCSEDKVVQILESMKIFLSLDGIIFILGINHDKIVELINKKYQTKNGEQYLKKFIQIPIVLTEWNQDEIINLIDNFLENDIINPGYKTIIGENKEIIASAIEENPREIKRFLNNLIISCEVFVKVRKIEDKETKNIFLKQLLLVQILKSNWSDIYRNLITYNGKFLGYIQNQIPITKEKIEQFLKTNSGIDSEIKELFEKYKANEKLWNLFDQNNFHILSIITDWNIFRRASKITDQFERIRNLIIKGQTADNVNIGDTTLEIVNCAGSSIKEVNFRDVTVEQDVDFTGASISSMNFADVALRRANFTGASISSMNFADVKVEQGEFSNGTFSSVNLRNISFSLIYCNNANFQIVNIKDTVFTWSTLVNTNFIKTNLENVNLIGAELTNSKFLGVSFEKVNLIGANLTDVIITNPLSYNELKVNPKTDFLNATIDDSPLIEYLLQNGCRNVPEQIRDKSTLRKKLENKGLQVNEINEIIRISKLPN